jgi:hypothetical protein
MRIEKVISRPEQPVLNAEQLTALGHYQGGVGAREQAIEVRKSREMIAAENVAARKDIATENRTLKREQDFQHELQAFGKKGIDPNDPTGTGTVIDYSEHLLKKVLDNPDSIPDRWKPEANALKIGFNRFADQVFATYKGKDKNFKDTPAIRRSLMSMYLNPPLSKK